MSGAEETKGARAEGGEVVTTERGARAMRDRATGELMHPVVGPRAEAEELYVAPSRLEARLVAGGDSPLVLFDVGLGAGSNAIAAWALSERLPPPSRGLEIVSFDRTTSFLALALAGENAAAFGFEGGAGDAARALLESGSHATPRTRWRLVSGDLRERLAAAPAAAADVVFWDPFSPRANPELWTVDAFRALRRVCREGATVHTYGAATATRAAMLLAGFAVGTGAPAGGGRQKETTVAATSWRDLRAPLDRRWLERLGRSSAPFPPGAPADARARIAAMAQFAGG